MGKLLSKKGWFIAAMFVLVVHGSAYASIITYDFSGKLGYVNDTNNLTGGAFNVGNTFKGFFSYDTNAVKAAVPNDPTVAVYMSAAGAGVTINGYAFNFTTTPFNPGLVQTWNNRDIGFGPLQDSFSSTSPLSFAPLFSGGSQSIVAQMVAGFYDNTGSVNSDLTIPTSLNLANFNGASFSFDELNTLTNQYFYLSGNIDTLTVAANPVPEPGTIALLIAGFMTISGMTWFKNFRSDGVGL